MSKKRIRTVALGKLINACKVLHLTKGKFSRLKHITWIRTRNWLHKLHIHCSYSCGFYFHGIFFQISGWLTGLNRRNVPFLWLNLYVIVGHLILRGIDISDWNFAILIFSGLIIWILYIFMIVICWLSCFHCFSFMTFYNCINPSVSGR